MTRQAYYQQGWSMQSVCVEEELIVQEVLKIRQHHRAMGTRKLYEKLQLFMLDHQIKMGRDALCYNAIIYWFVETNVEFILHNPFIDIISTQT